MTGDVHHMSMRGRGQRYLPQGKTEAQLATEYLRIAETYGIKVTLFATGKLFIEEWNEIQKWLAFNNLEIGGHTFRALTPVTLHWGFLRLLFGTPWGPKFVQRIDVARTVAIIESKMGKGPLSWRNHCYAGDQNTPTILERYGLQILSDEKSAHRLLPYRCGNLTILPINVMPDHEHLIHAHLSNANAIRDVFGETRYESRDWLKIVKNQIYHINTQGGIATLQVHPICMYQADRFDTFEKLCQLLANFTSMFAGELKIE